MADDGSVRTLLRSAADDLGAIPVPPVAEFTRRRHRRARLQAVGSVVCVVLIVAGLAVGLNLSSGGQVTATHPRPATTHPSGVTATALAGYRWRSLPPAPIPSRSNPLAVWTGTVLIVWGGAIGNDERTDGATYDPATRTWTKIPDAPAELAGAFAATWVAGSLVVWGNDGTGARYDLAARRWTALPAIGGPVSGSGPEPQLVTVGDRALLIRGALGGHTVRVDAYDPARNRWHQMHDLALPAGHDLGELVALVAGTDVYVWSEWAHVTQVKPNDSMERSGIDAYRLDPASEKWTSVNLPLSMSAAGATWTGTRILFPGNQRWCGFCSGPIIVGTHAVLVDPRSGTRIRVSEGPIGALASYFWTGSELLAVDNEGTEGHSILPGDTAVWNPRTGLWQKLPRGPKTMDYGATEVWAGDRLVVWGGEQHATAAEFAPPR